MSYPLLTKWLEDLFPVVDAEAFLENDPIADRLEAALDVCQHVFEPRYESIPDAVCMKPRQWHDESRHPFVPLVTP